MGNVKSKRTLDISSTPKKDVAVKVRQVTIHNYWDQLILLIAFKFRQFLFVAVYTITTHLVQYRDELYSTSVVLSD